VGVLTAPCIGSVIAYQRALTRFLEHVCRLPAVRCVPYTEVADWLDHHRSP
jgi:hypothetical protein